MDPTAQAPALRSLVLAGKRIECARFQPNQARSGDRAVNADPDDWSNCRLLLLHEGLGSITLWRTFPQLLADRVGESVIAYSRYGYGLSDVLAEPRTPGYMHEEAGVPLTSLREQLGLRNPILIGHSDGASIALLHAGACPGAIAGVVALAPHLFVEPFGVDSIRSLSAQAQAADLIRRLARYHQDARATFEGWSKIWLADAFASWNIEAEVSRIDCPVLAIQGVDDQFGSLRQIERIAELLPDVELLQLENCKHSPHLEQSEQTLTCITNFIRRIDDRSRTRNRALIP